MTEPQTGLFFEGAPHHHYLELTLRGGASAEDIRASLAALLALEPKRDFTVITGFGPAVYERLQTPCPPGLIPFPGYSSAAESAPATQADIWVWAQGTAADECLKIARSVMLALSDVAETKLEQQNLPATDNRDLIGFVDGTGNPKTWPAKEAAALDTEGGSYLLTQTWHHRLAKFEAIPEAEQEAVVGRTKYDDIELEGDAMPPNSHVSRTDVDVDGVAQKVYRRSAVIGTAATHGLYFISFACDLSRHDIQLRRMYGMTEDGLTDRMIEFSEAVTGSYFYVPSRAGLKALAES